MATDIATDNSTPIASVITPTFGRDEMLPHAYNVFKAQNIQNIEWIVVDDSDNKSAFMAGLSDQRVRYIYLPNRVSTGEKRNIAVNAARSNTIVQCDDDDYYAPSYIRTMIGCMARDQADFVKLESFFLYSKANRQFAYWVSKETDGMHFVFGSNTEIEVCRLSDSQDIKEFYLGYGFTYLFKKKVWESSPFPHIFWNEDAPFIKAAMSNGYKVEFASDQVGLCLRIVHKSNTSKSFPQYIIPGWLGKKIFPALHSAYL